RPVVADTVQRARPEVRGMEAREVPGIEDRAAADGVEVGYLDRRSGVVDGVVLTSSARVRAEAKIGELATLPVAAHGGILRGVHPVALLHAEDAHARLREAPGHRGAGRTRADDQDVYRVCRHPRLSRLASLAWTVPPRRPRRRPGLLVDERP